MHEFQALTDAQEAHSLASKALAEKMRQVFREGATETVVDGAGRRMLVEIRFIGHGSDAGYLRVMPINGKRTRRSLRTVHWTQIEREAGDV